MVGGDEQGSVCRDVTLPGAREQDEMAVDGTSVLKPRLVLPEAATNEAVFRAAVRLGAEGRITPVVLGRKDDFVTSGHVLSLSVRDLRVVYPVDDHRLERVVACHRDVGAGKVPADHIRALVLRDAIRFASGLLGIGDVQAFAGGVATDRDEVMAVLDEFGRFSDDQVAILGREMTAEEIVGECCRFAR